MDTIIIEEKEEIPFFLPEDIVNKITFENTHEIAYLLSMEQPVVATALLEELLYFREKNII
ncbi:MAG: hypothetical protein IE931_14670 [Sphingobacteriales bacterium]|nr:hypothetical protein [Sphingobacteriales bacterium]